METVQFGPNGWHARIGQGFDEEGVARICGAVATYWRLVDAGGRVLVGYDGRGGSRRAAELAASIIAAESFETLLSVESVPLPALAWAVAQEQDCAGALMLTASDLPSGYGGLVVLGPLGGPLSAAAIRQVDELTSAEAPRERGGFSTIDIRAGYLKDLHTWLDQEATEWAKLKVVVDPMYGACCEWGPELFDSLGCQVLPIHNEHLEDMGGIHPRPIEPWLDECESAVVDAGADLGLAFDGDGQRYAVIDEHGRQISPHVLTPLLLEWLVKEHDRFGRVVKTLATSSRVTTMAEHLGLETSNVPVGFGRLYREELEGDVILACEEYGGAAITDHSLGRDGLLASALVLERMASSRKTASEVADDVVRVVGSMDYGRRDIRLGASSMQAFRNVLPGVCPQSVLGLAPEEVSHADGLKIGLEDRSWLMIRPSRRSSVVRLYAEASSSRRRDALLDAAEDIARNAR